MRGEGRRNRARVVDGGEWERSACVENAYEYVHDHGKKSLQFWVDLKKFCYILAATSAAILQAGGQCGFSSSLLSLVASRVGDGDKKGRKAGKGPFSSSFAWPFSVSGGMECSDG